MPLLLGTLSILFWGNILFSSHTFSHDDFFRLFHPGQSFATEKIQCGDLPLWNPYVLGGYPHAAEPHTALFYPAQILLRIFGFLWGSKLFVLFHTLFSALFGVLLGRKLFSKKSAAGLCGLLFGFHGFFAYHAPFLSQFATLSWIPAVLLSMRSPTLLALVFSGMILSGFPLFFAGGIALAICLGLTLRSAGETLLKGLKASRSASG